MIPYVDKDEETVELYVQSVGTQDVAHVVMQEHVQSVGIQDGAHVQQLCRNMCSQYEHRMVHTCIVMQERVQSVGTQDSTHMYSHVGTCVVSRNIECYTHVQSCRNMCSQQEHRMVHTTWRIELVMLLMVPHNYLLMQYSVLVQ